MAEKGGFILFLHPGFKINLYIPHTAQGLFYGNKPVPRIQGSRSTEHPACSMACHNGRQIRRFIRYVLIGILTTYGIASLHVNLAGDKYNEWRDSRERSDAPIQSRSHVLKRTSYSQTVQNVSNSCEKNALCGYLTNPLLCYTVKKKIIGYIY